MVLRDNPKLHDPRPSGSVVLHGKPARLRHLLPPTLPLRGYLPLPAHGERAGVMYEPGRLVTELTGWIGDRSELSAGGGPADAVERDLSDGRTDAVYRSGFGGRG